MSKLYIITNSSFPYGNANSNYLRYFALSLKNIGWQVQVIGSNLSGDCQPKGEFEGIEYQNILLSELRLPFHLSDHLAYGLKLRKVIKDVGISENDYVFVYSMYMDLVKTMLKETSHLNQGHLAISMVEWFQPFQYRFGTKNPDYICWKYTFENLVTKYPKVFPISRKLQGYYSEAGCKTLLLPIMADTENNKNETLSVRIGGVSNFIYPGDANKKDSFSGLIEAIDMLSKAEIEKIKLHFTLLQEKTVDAIIKEKHLNGEKIKKALVFHGKLEYQKLLELYKEMDFLLIPREKNTVTLSNFPSKIPELMCYNIVPVCSDVGDYADLYLTDSVDSIIIDGCSARDCIIGIKRVLAISNAELMEMKKNARKTAEQKFDYHNWSAKIEDFLKK